MSPTIRVALGSVPKAGGTFTFYRSMRAALAARGVDLRCVTLGHAENRLWDEAFADAGCHRIAPRARRLRTQAEAFVDWCEASGIDVVIAINSEGILSALPHLPERIRVVARCANGFDRGYRVTMAGRDRLCRIVALTPRLRDDLVAGYGADPGRIRLIPNGVEEARFRAAAGAPRGERPRLEIGFLGRLEHGQKGVMHLPRIVAALAARGVPYRLRIAGTGRHEGALRAALAGPAARGEVAFLGALGPAEVPPFLGSIDVFAFTSHFEGCPNALLEAMMAGAVPVAWRIPGITDFLIDDGRTGCLAELGDAEAFAAGIAALAAARGRLGAMHRAAAAEARARFASEIAAEAYAGLFREVMAEAAPRWTPPAWEAFRPDPTAAPDWRNWIPAPAREAARRLLDRRRGFGRGWAARGSV